MTLIDQLKTSLGTDTVIDNPDAMQPYLKEWRGLYQGHRAHAIIRPENTEQLSHIIKQCNANATPVIPQGGNTGLVGGSVPIGNTGVIVSLERMNTIRAIDPLDYTMTVEAGCILANIQSAARDHNRYFPLSLGSEGTCQIGGNIATNAGGLTTIRYGNMRDLVLGLDVVLPDGQIWNGLKRLRKNNMGYDLKQLFIGSEGTLGIITAAVLKLYPRMAHRRVVMASVASPQMALEAYARLRERCGDIMNLFELMPDNAIGFAEKHIAKARFPMKDRAPWYILMECAYADENGGERLNAILETLIEDDIITDAILSLSEDQAASLLFLREAIVEAQRLEGGSIKHDVSVPISAIPDLIKRGIKAATDYMPGIRPMPFGHIGDGNIHFNLTQPEDMNKDAFISHWDALNDIIHNIVLDLGGSVCAEHGVGHLKATWLKRGVDTVEYQLMQKLKQMLDPDHILNPGKVVEVE